MFDAVPASRRYPCALIVFWRLATKICPLRAGLARLFAFCVTGPSWPPLAAFLADRGAKRDRAVQERGRRHVLCVRARQMHQRARSGASHGCKWDQHGIFNRFYVNRSARQVPSARCCVLVPPAVRCPLRPPRGVVCPPVVDACPVCCAPLRWVLAPCAGAPPRPAVLWSRPSPLL